jgi:WD40 repeat protein
LYEDNFSPEQIEQLPDALPLEDASLVRALQTVYQSEADSHKHSLEHVRARLAQQEVSGHISLPTQSKPLEGKIIDIKEKIIMEARNASQEMSSSVPRPQGKKRGSMMRTVGMSIIAAVAIITILSFTIVSNGLLPTQQTPGNGSSTIGGQSQTMSNGRQVCTFTTSYAVVNSIPWGPNLDWSTQGQIAASGYNTFQIASANSCQVAFSQPLQQNYTIRWSPDGSKVVMAGTSHTLDVFDRQGHSILHLTFAQLGADSVGDVFWSSDSTKLIFVSETSGGNEFSESIKSVNVSGGSNITTLMTLPPNCVPAFFSPDGKFFITSQIGNANQKVFAFWDLNKKKQVSTFLNPLPAIRAITVLSPDGSQVAVAEDKQIVIYTTADGKLASSFSAAQRSTVRPTSIAWSPDGKYLAEGTNTITIYDVQTKKAVATFGQVDAQHTITTLAWAPDGKGLVSATGTIDNSSPEATVHVWALS